MKTPQPVGGKKKKKKQNKIQEQDHMILLNILHSHIYLLPRTIHKS